METWFPSWMVTRLVVANLVTRLVVAKILYKREMKLDFPLLFYSFSLPMKEIFFRVNGERLAFY